MRNCDPNVTDTMISQCYDMRLDNIRILNTASSRVFKKYKSEFETAGQEFDKTFSMSDLIMFERAISYKSSGKTYQVAISEAIL